MKMHGFLKNNIFLKSNFLIIIFLYIFIIRISGDTSSKIISTATEDENILTSEEIIIVHKCMLINNCLECVKSNDLCSWFIDINSCSYDSEKIMNLTNPSYTIIKHQNSSRQNLRRGPFFCPRILNTKNIYVPSDTQQMIEFQVFLVEAVIIHSRFTCRFGDNSQSITTGAFLLGNTLHCNNVKFSYTTDEPFINLPVALFWEKNEILNSRQINLTIYKCTHMAHNCTSCLSLGNHYECGWCPGSSICEISGHCEETSADNRWLGRRSLCPEFSQ